MAAIDTPCLPIPSTRSGHRPARTEHLLWRAAGQWAGPADPAAAGWLPAVTGHGDARSWRIGCRPVCPRTIAWSVGVAACSLALGEQLRDPEADQMETTFVVC